MKRYVLLKNLGLYEILDTQEILDGKPKLKAIFADRAEAIRRCEDLNRYGERAA